MKNTAEWKEEAQKNGEGSNRQQSADGQLEGGEIILLKTNKTIEDTFLNESGTGSKEERHRGTDRERTEIGQLSPGTQKFRMLVNQALANPTVFDRNHPRDPKVTILMLWLFLPLKVKVIFPQRIFLR